MYQNKISLMPQDILEKDFKIDTRGYRLKEVDQFLDIIIGDYEQFLEIISNLEKEKADFKAYKDEQANKKAMDDKKAVYTELLKDAGISEKRIDSILRVTDFTNMELGEDGKLKDIFAWHW